MKALVYTGPKELDCRDVPDAVPQAGEELIRVDSVGICGSDMHAYLGHDARRPAPLILGHEAAGVITGGPRDGQRVTINPLVTCGACRACLNGQDNLCPARQIISMPPREGAFAELLAMPGGNLVPVPDNVPLSKAALAEPIACGWHAVRLSLAVLGRAERALVLGGGAIGVGAALSLKARGVNEVLIAEPNAPRRRFLELNCDFPAVAPDQVPGADYDIVIDGVGHEATRAQASALVRPGGVIGHIGLGQATGGLDIRRMTLQEVTFIGTYTYTAQDFQDTAQAIFEGRLGRLDWFESRALADGAKSFADIRAGMVASPKIILTP
ncbi:zinc-binding dehydrogenase [Roseovarius sp. A21]|uniref:Zinc-binding dehydrogenase n=1 Tax=Roseovarius bejariae TaxID=2576383 RepID=A0A844CS91_9RHOB|nr:alcohol dehydrogenase catalytic domain-containing protein [Roseovarius bejariae]MRU14869.1 zinc-binding dehydrogenase [Roseovarius bejariae]